MDRWMIGQLPPPPSMADWEAQIVNAQALPPLPEPEPAIPLGPAPLPPSEPPDPIPLLTLPPSEPPDPIPLLTLPQEQLPPTPPRELLASIPGLGMVATAEPPDFEARAVGAARGLDDISRQREELRRKRADLVRQAAVASDPAALQQLGAQVAAIDASDAQLVQDRQGQLGTLEDATAQTQAQVMARQRALAAEGAQELAARQQELATEKAAREAARQQELAKMRTQLAQDRASFRAFQEQPPATGWADVAQTLAEILNESVRADIGGRVPNYGEILQRSTKRRQGTIQAMAQRKLSLIESTGDALTDLRREQDEARALEAAAAADELQDLEQQLQQRVASAADPLQRIQDATALEALRAQRGQAEQAALAAREDADRKRARDEADLALKGAQVRKTTAEATKAEAEAAKLARRGRGGAPAVGPGLVAPNVVTLPGSDKPLVQFPATKEGAKEAAVTRDLVGGAQGTMELVADVARLTEDAEDPGYLESLGITRAQANQDLRAKRALLRTRLAQLKAGPGLATTEGDDKWAGTLVGEDLAAWTNVDTALAQVEAVRRAVADELRNQIGRKTRLDMATRERLVQAAGVRRVSRKQKRREAEQRAPETLADEAAPAADRIAAVEFLEERARAAGDDWPAVAARELGEVYQTVEDPDVKAEMDQRLQRYEQILRERQRVGAEGARMFRGGAVPVVGSETAAKPQAAATLAAKAAADAAEVRKLRERRFKADVEQAAPQLKAYLQSLLPDSD